MAGILVGEASAWSAQDAAVDAEVQGNALVINAHATIRAPLPLIWHTLTDYDHLAEFIPGMKKKPRRRTARQHGDCRADWRSKRLGFSLPDRRGGPIRRALSGNNRRAGPLRKPQTIGWRVSH